MFGIMCCRHVANNVSKVQAFSLSLRKNVKRNDFTCSKGRNSSPNDYMFRINNIRTFSQQTNSEIKGPRFHANTNVRNNVILYKNNKISDIILFRVVGITGIAVAFIMSYYTIKQNMMSTWTGSLIDYFKLNGARLGYIVFSIIIGPCLSVLLYVLCSRLVKYIILLKGGKEVCIITHHLFKREHVMKVPLKDIKVNFPREDMKDYLVVKLRNHSLYYLIHSDGKFVNLELFDDTICGYRDW